VALRRRPGGPLAQLARAGRRAAAIHFGSHDAPGAVAAIAMAGSSVAYAHDLYAALRDMDHAGADIILVERRRRTAPGRASTTACAARRSTRPASSPN
jgi:hypothetical protein